MTDLKPPLISPSPSSIHLSLAGPETPVLNWFLTALSAFLQPIIYPTSNPFNLHSLLPHLPTYLLTAGPETPVLNWLLTALSAPGHLVDATLSTLSLVSPISFTRTQPNSIGQSSSEEGKDKEERYKQREKYRRAQVND